VKKIPSPREMAAQARRMDVTAATAATVARLRETVPHLGERILAPADLDALLDLVGIRIAGESSGIEGVPLTVVTGRRGESHPLALCLPPNIQRTVPPTPAEVQVIVRAVCMWLEPHPAKLVREWNRTRRRRSRGLKGAPAERQVEIIHANAFAPGHLRMFIVADVAGLAAALPFELRVQGAVAQVEAVRDLRRIHVWHERLSALLERLSLYLWSYDG
jgi:hypothetical protein